ncbi:hypothetical protein LQG66_28340 [Bradyrhizobium ontarionense]|uniref:DUF1266 domain-containing protein n=1 Tax=Bradyrhizobium ontarionense TaxID=2898149 RepID=A0ABY3R712_9BRAD|nr:hypothetical protein [Bradyrhizobium sp. A19]UFZ03121.1 hypothetical protein LQG66_28340 [Bradyrhizobium sp. A19]
MINIAVLVLILAVVMVFIWRRPIGQLPASKSEDRVLESVAAAEDDELMLFYHKDPQPERLVGLWARWAGHAYKAASPWSVFPPAIGFFSVVFREHPEWIERLLPSWLDDRSAVAIDAALALSGNSAIRQQMQARFAKSGANQMLKDELGALPSEALDIQIATPTHLDILWGAFFASGDERYVRRIIEFLAQTADRSELIAIDIANVNLAMAGGPNEIIGQLKEKYAQSFAGTIAYAATAAWALGANATRHEKVAHAIEAYMSEHPATHTTKVLSVIGPR